MGAGSGEGGKVSKGIPKQKIAVYDLDDAERLASELAASDILSNATRVGMHPLEEVSLITDASLFRKNLVVTDVIYKPEKTRLLQDAEAAGCKVVGGLGMIIYQGAEAAKFNFDNTVKVLQEGWSEAMPEK